MSNVGSEALPAPSDPTPTPTPVAASPLPARLLAARSHVELRDLLGDVLRAQLRRTLRYELYITVAGGALVPVVKRGEQSLDAGLRLLRALYGRLKLRPGGGRVEEPQLCAAPSGVRRGSLMSAPLSDGTLLIGAVVVESPPGQPSLTPADLAVLESVAALFALAVARLRAKESERYQSRVERDLAAASRLQRRFMRGTVPDGLGVRVRAEYLPAYEIGGDFYDLAARPDGKLAVVVGDVSGKGMAAALVTARLGADLRRGLTSAATPAEVLRAANGSWPEELGETFATAVCLELDTRARRVTVANAGHLPIIVRRHDGTVETFGPASGPPLGMVPCDYTEESFALEPQDILLLMTDGLVEALDRPSDRMGRSFLVGLIQYAAHDPELIHSSILEAVRKMRGPRLLDDCTLVALQLEA
jgi:serine phosphatase RsbU (regulator of sigma subunit)